MLDAALKEKLILAPDVPAIHSIANEITAHLGFEHFTYATRIPVSVSEPFHFVVNGYPHEWKDLYEREGYLGIDPVIAHVLASIVPIVWDEIDRNEQKVQEFFDKAATFGLEHGISVPIYGRRGDIGLFSIARRAAISGKMEVRTELIQRAHYFAPLLNEAIQRTVLTTEGNPIIGEQLTPRERACLSMAADGKTSIEIAGQLALSPRTVIYHVQNATNKLGVQTRQGAIAKAVALGEITPRSYDSSSDGRMPVIHDILH